MKKLLTGITAILFSTMILTSCTKEGPAGPAGATGPVGPTGATGPAGPTGQTGNANVRSNTITLLPNNWSWNNASNNSYSDITWSAITSDVFNYGFVYAFIKSTNNGQDIWIPLPKIEPLTPTVWNKYDIAYISLGGLRIRYAWSDNRNSPPTTTNTFKLVAVSGTAKAANPNVNWQDWNQVKEALHITE